MEIENPRTAGKTLDKQLSNAVVDSWAYPVVTTTSG